MASTKQADDDVAWFLKTSVPVLLPAHDALTLPRHEFEVFVRRDIARRHGSDEDSSTEAPVPDETMTVAASDSFTEINPSTTADIRENIGAMDIDVPSSTDGPTVKVSTGNPFMDGLFNPEERAKPRVNLQNKTFTENGDLAHRSTTNALVDLFSELEDLVTGPRLRELLEQAWALDPLITLKIIFNARSIHLGKTSRNTFYRCAGWLAQNHPLTLIANLRWLSRPVIEKKAKKDNDEDVMLVDEHVDENDPLRFDVKNGVAHGYWKDMLNILALAANKKLDVLSDPRSVLNSENPGIIGGKSSNRMLRRLGKGGRRSRGTVRVRGIGRIRGRGGASMGFRTSGAGSGKRSSLYPFTSTPGRVFPGFSPGIPPPPKPSHVWRKVRDVTGPRWLRVPIQYANNFEVAEESFEDEAVEEEAVKETPKVPSAFGHSEAVAKDLRRCQRIARHQALQDLLNDNPVYRGLHFSIARLFAEQLESDLAALRGDNQKAKRDISLCAKWAPTHDHFHDKHTFVLSSIAEILYPREAFDDVLSAADDRETYLRHARERYRKDTSALRKHLDIVERKLTEKDYEAIKYERVPSMAMKNYAGIFIKNDMDRFEKYIDNVAEGKAKISGATLLPSTMVHAARIGGNSPRARSAEEMANVSPAVLIKEKMERLEASVVNGQWNTLVQRIKDSGTLSSSIAVCDVSGSMNSPVMADSTTPMDSAIGLSLLVAEVTAPPFGGAFITFSQDPRVETLNLSSTFREKIRHLEAADWGMNTNFVSVFTKLILPMAVQKKVKQEDMVKRVFVFSDMQFDAAQRRPRRSLSEEMSSWETSYDHIKRTFEEAGYELPELIFWNLAGGGRQGGGSKPVTTTDYGTALVSGYSQGMLKVFLEGGGFDDEKDEDEVVVTKTEGGEITTEVKKPKTDPLKTVKRAIGHKAYDMLEVLD